MFIREIGILSIRNRSVNKITEYNLSQFVRFDSRLGQEILQKSLNPVLLNFENKECFFLVNFASINLYYNSTLYKIQKNVCLYYYGIGKKGRRPK